MAKQKKRLDKEEAEVVQLQKKNLQMQMAESGSQGEHHFLSEQATPEKKLAQKSSELEQLSKQLFQTVPPKKPDQEVEAISTFSTSQFFATPSESSALRLIDTAGDGCGWN